MRQSAPFVLMPKTSMYEHHLAPGWKRNVRPARNAGKLNPEAVANAVKQTADHLFWFGVGPSDPGHVSAALGRGEAISHSPL
jgi:hypothetical protein